MNFLTSKFSGYLSLILVASLAAGAWYMYQRGVTFGELQEAAETLSRMEKEREALDRKIAAKEAAIESQLRQTNALRRQAEATRQDIREALNDAPESYIDARNTVVPERLRFWPSRSDNGSKP